MEDNRNNLNKMRSLFGIGLSILFVLLGIFLLIEVPENSLNFSPLVVKVTGIACILFFGTLLIIGARKLLR
jgi:hypothetical protein